MSSSPPRVAGLLLAAGSGRRYGMPKALADTGDGPWVLRSLAVLADCAPVLVVTGARDADVVRLLPAGVSAVRNPDHSSGMASSLRAGLDAMPSDVDAVLIALVDLPDVTVDVARRVLARAAERAGVGRVLARAVFDGRPGHPVLIGREHLAGVLASLSSPDTGAAGYLAAHGVVAVECGDMAGGRDEDVPAEASSETRRGRTHGA